MPPSPVSGRRLLTTLIKGQGADLNMHNEPC